MGNLSEILGGLLIQSSLTILMVTILSWLGLAITQASYVLFATYVVGALFISRLLAVVVVTIRGMHPGYMRSLAMYAIVVGVATLLLILFAGDVILIQYWWIISAIIVMGDIFASLIIRGIRGNQATVIVEQGVYE